MLLYQSNMSSRDEEARSLYYPAFDLDALESAQSAPCSPLYVPTLASDLEGQGIFEDGGALREEVEQISSRKKSTSLKTPAGPKQSAKSSSTLQLASAQAAVPTTGSGCVTADCKCKTRQAVEGDRLAALEAMKRLALGGPDRIRRDLASKLQFM